MSAQFMPGLELSRRFFEEAVRPILASSFPQLTYSAARVGSGSEVLGFDTERSPDHEWGPRLQLFLSEDDMSTSAESVTEALSERLPKEFLGWSTHFGPEDSAIRAMEPTTGAGSAPGRSDERLRLVGRRDSDSTRSGASLSSTGWRPPVNDLPRQWAALCSTMGFAS